MVALVSVIVGPLQCPTVLLPLLAVQRPSAWLTVLHPQGVWRFCIIRCLCFASWATDDAPAGTALPVAHLLCPVTAGLGQRVFQWLDGPGSLNCLPAAGAGQQGICGRRRLWAFFGAHLAGWRRLPRRGGAAGRLQPP